MKASPRDKASPRNIKNKMRMVYEMRAKRSDMVETSYSIARYFYKQEMLRHLQARIRAKP